MRKSRIFFAAWGFFVLLLCLFTGALTAFVLFFFTLLLLIWCFACSLLLRNKIVCSFEIQKMTEKNQDAWGILELWNRSRLPAGKICVELSFHNLLTGEKRTRRIFCSAGAKAHEKISWSLESAYCGNIRVTVKRIEAYDFMGLFGADQPSGNRESVIVLPDIFDVDVEISEGLAVNWESMRYSELKRGDDPSEIFGIRPYEPGDSQKYIHWKLSWKLGNLYVKEPSLPTENAILLFFETADLHSGVKDPKGQAALMEAFLSVSQCLCRQGISHMLGWYDQRKERLCMENVESEDNLTQMIQGLLSLERRERNFTGLGEYIRRYQENPFGHVVYFTAEEPENECGGISDVCCFTVVRQGDDLERLLI